MVGEVLAHVVGEVGEVIGEVGDCVLGGMVKKGGEVLGKVVGKVVREWLESCGAERITAFRDIPPRGR